MRNLKAKIKNSKTKRGFTIVEVSIAMAIFSLMMIATANFFGSSVSSYKNAKAVQKDVENAQFSMNLMAKTLRTSTVFRCRDAGGTQTAPGTCPTGEYASVSLYDYSQAKCVNFSYNNAQNKITINYGSLLDSLDVNGGCAWEGAQDMAASHVNNAVFYVVKSATTPTPVVGKVTTSIEICSNANCSGSEIDKVHIQSSLSLRDFKESGI